jgi:hypothetical protein
VLGRALGILVLALWPAGAAAQSDRLSLNWDHCVGSGALTDQTFDCGNPEASHRLVLEFRPPSFAYFFAVDIVIDVLETGQSDVLHPFWHDEATGCNSTGLGFSINRSELGTAVLGCAHTITGSAGSQASGLITAYGAGYRGANRARLLITVARPNTSPIDLVEGTNYYLGHLIFSMQNSCSGTERTCFGCRDQVSMAWTCATLYRTSGQPLAMEAPAYATVNGGPVVCLVHSGYFSCEMDLCGESASHSSPSSAENDCSKEVTSVKQHSWGSLKSLYR